MSIFANREDAGKLLGEHLQTLELRRPLVLGIPRGGIPIAVAVGREIPEAEVGVVVARKLGAPGQPELAIGAVTANGAYFVDEPLARSTGANANYVHDELRRQQAEARRREEQFDGHRRPDVAGRDVIIVDDGVATGATAIAAIRAIKAAGARCVCFAIPVGPPSTIRQLTPEADKIICLHQPGYFRSVGQFYRDFRAVPDDEAIRLLASFRPPMGTALDERES